MSFMYLFFLSTFALLVLQRAVWGEVGTSTVSPEPNNLLLEDSGGMGTTETFTNSSAIIMANNVTEESHMDIFADNSTTNESESGNNNNVTAVEDSLEDLGGGGLLVDSRLGLEELEGFFHSLGLNQTGEDEEGLPPHLTSNSSSIKLLEDLKEILEIALNNNTTSAINNNSSRSEIGGNETQASGIFSSLMDIIISQDMEGNNSTMESSNTTSASY